MRRRLILIAATWAAVVGLVAGSGEAQAPTSPGGQFFVVGVVMLEGGRDLAWIQEPNFTGNKVVTVRLGDSVGPYRVTKILTHQVELTGPGGTVSVPLGGVPGAVSVASSAGTAQGPAGALPPGELPPTPALQNSQEAAEPLLRGDSGRIFPAAQIWTAGASQAWQPQAPQPQAVPAPALPPTPTLQNNSQEAAPLLRGDPRRWFPVEKFFLRPGQGPQVQ